MGETSTEDKKKMWKQEEVGKPQSGYRADT